MPGYATLYPASQAVVPTCPVRQGASVALSSLAAALFCRSLTCLCTVRISVCLMSSSGSVANPCTLQNVIHRSCSSCCALEHPQRSRTP